MNKKETEYVDGLLTRLALRWTSPVQPDIPRPTGGNNLTQGFLFNDHLTSARVEVACSSQVHHAFGRNDKTTTQGSRSLYSTRLLALRALRYGVEKRCAELLRGIDRQIEHEESVSADNVQADA